MSDDSEQGAVPVDDAAVEDPPTVDEVMEQQEDEFPEQAATSTLREPRHAASHGDEDALADEPAQEDER